MVVLACSNLVVVVVGGSLAVAVVGSPFQVLVDSPLILLEIGNLMVMLMESR